MKPKPPPPSTKEAETIGLTAEDRAAAAANVAAQFDNASSMPSMKGVLDPGHDALAEVLAAFGHVGHAAWERRALDRRAMTNARGGAPDDKDETWLRF